VRQEQGATTDPGGRKRRLGTGMAPANDEDIEIIGMLHD